MKEGKVVACNEMIQIVLYMSAFCLSILERQRETRSRTRDTSKRNGNVLLQQHSSYTLPSHDPTSVIVFFRSRAILFEVLRIVVLTAAPKAVTVESIPKTSALDESEELSLERRLTDNDVEGRTA